MNDMDDMVNRPPHYTQGKIEIIDIIEQITEGYPPEIAYHIGTVIKYLGRAPYKTDMDEDLKKAYWYLGRALECNARSEDCGGEPVDASAKVAARRIYYGSTDVDRDEERR